MKFNDAEQANLSGRALLAPQIQQHEYEGYTMERSVEKGRKEPIESHYACHAKEEHSDGVGCIAEKFGRFVCSSVLYPVHMVYCA